MNRRLKKYCFCAKLVLFFGLVSICLSITSYYFTKSYLNKEINENVWLKKDSRTFKSWSKPPAEILRSYYFFDVKNPKEIVEGKEKPNLIERGPYTYREIWEKRNVQFFDNKTLSYSPVTTLRFEPSLSVGNESDIITFLNIPTLTLLRFASRLNSDSSQTKAFTFGALELVLLTTDLKLFIKKSIGQIIHGYDDMLMGLAKTIFPDRVKNDKFSLDNDRSGNVYQNFTIKSGQDSSSDVGKIINWNGKTKLNVWNNQNADSINGTDGSLYPPFRRRDEVLYSFSPDMCRSYNLKYLKDNVIHGIPTYDFHLPENIFYNSTLNPENEGFCPDGCLGNGVHNLSRCFGGAPSFMSQPHFLNAEQKFLDAVEGLNPDKEKHDFILHFEPTSGIPISGNARLQMNFYIENNKNFKLLRNIKSVLLPVVWIHVKANVDLETRSQLSILSKIVNFSFLIPLIIFSIGMTLILISFFMYAYVFTKTKTFRKTIKYNEVNENNTTFKLID